MPGFLRTPRWFWATQLSRPPARASAPAPCPLSCSLDHEKAGAMRPSRSHPGAAWSSRRSQQPCSGAVPLPLSSPHCVAQPCVTEVSCANAVLSATCARQGRETRKQKERESSMSCDLNHSPKRKEKKSNDGNKKTHLGLGLDLERGRDDCGLGLDREREREFRRLVPVGTALRGLALRPLEEPPLPCA